MAEAPHVHFAAVCVFLGIVVFEIGLNTAVQVLWYRMRRGESEAWKIQPSNRSSLGAAADRWWLPAWFPDKPKRSPLHRVYASVR